MKKFLTIFGAFLLSSLSIPAKANFGDADFPAGMFDDGPKSYHDAWCRTLENECRVRFQGPAMWVEGQGGIFRNQFLKYRYDHDREEYYNYIRYKDSEGKIREALFLFVKTKAQGEFMRAFIRWKESEGQPIPNYRYPGSQGPQDTQGRDKGLNPYDNQPIDDWSIKSRFGLPKKCTNGTWNKNHPRCQVKPSSPMDMD